VTPAEGRRVIAMAKLLTHEGHMTQAGYVQMKKLAHAMTDTPSDTLQESE
jgi:hypothetical protein